MIPKLRNQNGVVFNFIYDPVVVGDSPRPVSGEIMFKGFGFPDSLVPVPLNISDQFVDPLQILLVVFLPVQVILPGIFGKNQFH